MRWTIFVTPMLAVALVSHNTSAGVYSKTYRCSTKDAVAVQSNGSFGRDDDTELWRNHFDGLLVDTLTGAITYSTGLRHQWKVVGDGKNTAGNDYVLVPQFVFSRTGKDMLAAAAGDFIRNRSWTDDRKVKFTAWVSGLTLVSGTCEIARRKELALH
jgi:hypothetical protein